jgi:hypothetical protein
MTDQREHDGEGFDGSGFDEDDLPARRPSPIVRIVAVVVVAAVVLSAAAVVVGVLTSRDDPSVDASGPRGGESASAEVTDTSKTPQPPATLEPMTTQMSPCEPLDPAAIAEVLGVASVDVVRMAPDEAGCRVAAAPWTVSYAMVESAEPIGNIPAEPLDVGDEAFVTTSNDRGGNWTATGFVRVGDRMMVLTVQSDARGVDTYPGVEGPAVQPQVRERAVALLQALSARL